MAKALANKIIRSGKDNIRDELGIRVQIRHYTMGLMYNKVCHEIIRVIFH